MGIIRAVLSGRSKTWWIALIGWVLAASFAVAWLASLVPYASVWGDLGTWATAILTGVGLFYAGLGLRHQVQQRQHEAIQKKEDEKELRLVHARSVAIASNAHFFVDFDDPLTDRWHTNVWRISYELVNATGYPIDSVVVLTPLADGSGGYEDLLVGTVLPGRSAVGWSHQISTIQPPISEMVDVCLVDFTDQWGTHWRRGPSKLEKRESAARVN